MVIQQFGFVVNPCQNREHRFMGVPGLWDILRPAGHTRSITHLSVVDGFDRNSQNLRGYRVGIDAFIWIFHSEWGREGENPQLRTIMFRIVKLVNSPFLPLFVFDGPGRPSEKRGKKVHKRRAPALVEGIKRLITAFGLEWRTVSHLPFIHVPSVSLIFVSLIDSKAPGEAEAELAYLNSIGVIDGIISDDVDAFLFGAKVIIRKYVH
jgi:Holliday junction resolvase YEN1